MFISKYSLTHRSSIKTSADFDILLSFFVVRNFRGTWSSVEMLKGYIFEKG